MDIQQVKQRFGIIGNAPLLNRALEVAIHQTPPIDSFLLGEFFPMILLSHYLFNIIN
ncbi:MAG: hypothetical protein KC454_04645 [Flavobacteriales bacterium]|nr:hypothetical protein [Flavobacteriales bacterium]